MEAQLQGRVGLARRVALGALLGVMWLASGALMILAPQDVQKRASSTTSLLHAAQTATAPKHNGNRGGYARSY